MHYKNVSRYKKNGGEDKGLLVLGETPKFSVTRTDCCLVLPVELKDLKYFVDCKTFSSILIS